MDQQRLTVAAAMSQQPVVAGSVKSAVAEKSVAAEPTGPYLVGSSSQAPAVALQPAVVAETTRECVRGDHGRWEILSDANRDGRLSFNQRSDVRRPLDPPVQQVHRPCKCSGHCGQPRHSRNRCTKYNAVIGSNFCKMCECAWVSCHRPREWCKVYCKKHLRVCQAARGERPAERASTTTSIIE